MMGRTHALTGWCAGLALAPLLGQSTVESACLVAVTTAGWALAPDLDHPTASASRIAGPITGLVSRGTRKVSEVVYQATKGPRDEDVRGGHRHLSHTVLFAAGIGGAVGWLTSLWGWWMVIGVIAFGVLLAEDRLGDWIVLPTTLGAIALFANFDGATAALESVSGWIGWAVAVGCIVHDLGDSLTKSGCPYLWPIPIAGETWYEIRPPKALRFRTGSWVENLVIFPACAIAGVLLVPGVWPMTNHVVTEALAPLI